MCIRDSHRAGGPDVEPRIGQGGLSLLGSESHHIGHLYLVGGHFLTQVEHYFTVARDVGPVGGDLAGHHRALPHRAAAQAALGEQGLGVVRVVAHQIGHHGIGTRDLVGGILLLHTHVVQDIGDQLPCHGGSHLAAADVVHVIGIVAAGGRGSRADRKSVV